MHVEQIRIGHVFDQPCSHTFRRIFDVFLPEFLYEFNMPVSTTEEFEGHFSGAVNAVLVITGRAKFGVAAKRDEFNFTAMRAAIHGSTKRGIPAINLFFYIFHDNGAGMKDIFYFLIVIYKNLLKYVHKSIMQEMRPESNPTPQD